MHFERLVNVHIEKVGKKGTNQSPQRVMSMTSCWGVKNWLMLHDEDGHAADGVPNVDGSIVFPAFVMDDGMVSL